MYVHAHVHAMLNKKLVLNTLTVTPYTAGKLGEVFETFDTECTMFSIVQHLQ